MIQRRVPSVDYIVNYLESIVVYNWYMYYAHLYELRVIEVF